MKKIFYLFCCLFQDNMLVNATPTASCESSREKYLCYLKHKSVDICLFVAALLVSHRIIKSSEKHPTYDKYEKIAKHIRHEISEELYNIHIHHKPLEIFIITVVLSLVIVGMHYGILHYAPQDHAYILHTLINTFLAVLTVVTLLRHNIRFAFDEEYHSH